ncbi:MAG TPA: type II CAAX endopeptidase family protein [Bryobacteraceae bacterium]|jgi:membrane protease YdiL (CAAX protease family)|nr:type II CAAX endopeptidase family protein [Bryobacteraceae bacterium]
MTPNDPQQESDLAPVPPPTPQPTQPFWDYQDLGLFISLCFPSLLITILLVRSLSNVIPYGKPFQGLLAQLVWYVLVFSSLYALLRLRYRQPFWRSLGWKMIPLSTTAMCFAAGPFLAIAIGYLGYLLRTPEISLPFQQMLDNRPTLLLFSVFVVIIGPVCEELAFRGFLLPLFVRSLGAAAGIIFTGLLFGCLHAPEYSWSWRHVLLVALAGCVFGWARYQTGSTIAAAYMHSTYNLTQFAAFVAQSRTI